MPDSDDPRAALEGPRERTGRPWLGECPGWSGRFGPRSCVDARPGGWRKPCSCSVPPTLRVRPGRLQSEGRPRAEGPQRCCARSHGYYKRSESVLQRVLSHTIHPPASPPAPGPTRRWKPSQPREGTSRGVEGRGPGTRGRHPSSALSETRPGAPTRRSREPRSAAARGLAAARGPGPSPAAKREASVRASAARGTLDAPRGIARR